VSKQPDLTAEALERLRAASLRVANDAEAALDALTWGEGLQVITQHGLQRFLWHELPRKWAGDLDDKLHIAASLARLLDLVGLPRYAALCRAEQTASILTAYDRDQREGFIAFQHAEQRSGVSPPDLPELTWGAVMGPQEATARAAIAAALELAIASGELRPGSRGWRTAQQDTARRPLTVPRRELHDRSWLEEIRSERATEWIRSRSPARDQLIGPLADRVLAPTDAPEGLDQALAPLQWLLDGAAEGLPLTQKGNLARPLVIDAVNRFGWDPLPNPPRGEDDVFELWALRDLADALRLVRRRGARMFTTQTGRTLAGNPERLWRATCAQLGAGRDLAALVRELALAILHDGQPHPQNGADAADRILAAVTGEGWQHRATGQPLQADALWRPWYDLLRLLRVLGMTEEGGDWHAKTITLNRVGQATAHQALYVRATSPRPNPFR
jgi:hypothetical protein